MLGPNANRTLTLTANYAGCKSGAGGPILPECTFVNPLQGLTASARASSEWDDEVLYAQGVEIDTPDTSGISAAVAAAKEADVAVVIGGLITCQEVGYQCQEAEARDRSSPVACNDPEASCPDIGRDVGIGLPGKQLALLQALATQTTTPIVLVIMSGSSVATPWAAASDRVGAIVQHFCPSICPVLHVSAQSWRDDFPSESLRVLDADPGVLGGEALAEVLFGARAPSGRLPVMIPTNESQLPKDYLDQSMMAPPGRTHRYFTSTPLYPFGFGLGYSTHSYGQLRVSHESLAAGTDDLETELTISVDVTNHGEYTGAHDEVVMVFAKPSLRDEPTAEMSVPRQMLLGFARIATAPGATTTATVRVPAKRLRLYGKGGEYELLRGGYELHVGGRAPGEVAGVEPPLTRSLRVA